MRHTCLSRFHQLEQGCSQIGYMHGATNVVGEQHALATAVGKFMHERLVG